MPGGWVGWTLLILLGIVGTLYFLVKRFVRITIRRVTDAALGQILSQLDRPAFEQGVRDYCASIGKPIVVNHDFSAQFENAADRDEFSEISLHNLALRCAKYQADAYPQLIANHFRILTSKEAMLEGAAELTASYESAREQIAVRLYNQAYADSQQQNLENMHQRKLAENLFAVVVLDLPDIIVPLMRDETQSWGVSDEEISRPKIS